MRTDGYTVEELDALPLLPITRRGEVFAYVDIDHPKWGDTETQFFNDMADPNNWHDEHMVVKLCKSSKGKFFPITMFPVKVVNGKATWETSIRENRLIIEREQREKFRSGNLPIVRMYVTGSTNTRIVCPRFKFEIDEVQEADKVMSNWVQHHFRFVNGVSVHKDNADPGAILSNYDFTEVAPRSREGLKDMARTIFLSSSYHDLIHKARKNGDISDYSNDQLPWALRCEANWIAFNTYLGQFGHDPLGEYQAWFDEQKN